MEGAQCDQCWIWLGFYVRNIALRAMGESDPETNVCLNV